MRSTFTCSSGRPDIFCARCKIFMPNYSAPSGGPLTATGIDTRGNGSSPMDIKVEKKAIAGATEKLKTWGRGGRDAPVGPPNQVTPQAVGKAPSLIRTG